MQVSIYIPAKLVAMIDQQARRRLVSRSHFITRAVREMINARMLWSESFFLYMDPIPKEFEADVDALVSWRSGK
ncbi:MAG TPA: ribbon-helix-helix domain-containing protein [Labilithrix sp.]